MSIRPLVEPENDGRVVPFLPDIDPAGARFTTIERDFVKVLPEGTYVAMVFRVTGYDRDCDGSALVRLEQVDRHGGTTGWEPHHLGLYADTDVVLDGPGDLHEIADSASQAVAKRKPSTESEV